MPLESDPIGVAVIKMVSALSAGVLFTADPNTGDTSRMTIEANWGLGEGVVSGAESVDSFVVDKGSLEVTGRNVRKKSRCVVYRERGAGWEDVDTEKQCVPCLSDEEIKEIQVDLTIVDGKVVWNRP